MSSSSTESAGRSLDAEDGHLRLRGHDPRVAKATRRLDRGGRDDRRRDHRQGRRRDPLPGERPFGADHRRAGRDACRSASRSPRSIPAQSRARRIPRRTQAGSGRSPSRADAGRPAEPDRSGFYSPVVRRIADKHGVDLEQVEGSGIGGRVRKKDVLAYVEAARQRQGKPAPVLHSESPYRPEEPAPVRRPSHRASARPDRRASRADDSDAQADRRAHGREQANLGALHDHRRGRHVAGRGASGAAQGADEEARRGAHLSRLRRPRRRSRRCRSSRC